MEFFFSATTTAATTAAAATSGGRRFWNWQHFLRVSRHPAHRQKHSGVPDLPSSISRSKGDCF